MKMKLIESKINRKRNGKKTKKWNATDSFISRSY